jgi:hypothetical protein
LTVEAEQGHVVCGHLERLLSAGYELVSGLHVDGRAVLRLCRPDTPTPWSRHTMRRQARDTAPNSSSREQPDVGVR